MTKDINKILQGMRNAGKLKDMKEKGNSGEEAVKQLLIERKNKNGGLLYHSFTYPYQTKADGQPVLGNIKLENGRYIQITEVGRQLFDEIDLLYISNYKIFAIEVKAYHARLDIYDNWVKKNGVLVDKSPITQAEKHARHLYNALWEVLPDGQSKYIIPVVCFVDRCTYNDTRSVSNQLKIPVCTLNSFNKTINKLNKPLEYLLDLEAIQRRLKAVEKI